ncbi:MAG: hypothetical protein V4704_11285 [Pseudomonadota bacterium]
MRKVFTSPRLENVEAVANLLREQGIEVKIDQSRSYRGQMRSTFSYRVQEDDGPQPSVWIVHAGDQPRGRQLLRDAGLLESTRAGEGSYLPLSVLDREEPAARAKARRASWIKAGLLGLIAIGIGLVFFATRKPVPVVPAAPVATAPAPRVIVPQSAEELSSYRAAVPTALARLLIEAEIATRAPRQACIAIDGQDPAPAFIAGLDAGTARLFAKSACPGDAALSLAVQDYTTDGTGTGNVRVDVDGDARSFDVEREGLRWRVLRER